MSLIIFVINIFKDFKPAKERFYLQHRFTHSKNGFVCVSFVILTKQIMFNIYLAVVFFFK